MLLSQEELAQSSVILPEIAEVLKDFPLPNFDDPDELLHGMREVSVHLAAQHGDAPPGTEELYHDIPMRDGYMSSLKIHKPSAPEAPGPLIVLIFGGGFIAGDNNQMTFLSRTLVVSYHATVVNISYRLAPEHKFPQGQYDAIDSVKWIAENATGPLLASDPSQGFIIGGASAGASIAACLSRKFQNEKLAHPLTGQWLNVPTLMDIHGVPDKYKPVFISHEQNAGAPMLSSQALQIQASLGGWDMSSELRCPTKSTTPASGQPKTYFQVNGLDPLRDDGLVYEEILKEAGVPTKMDFYPGCPHGYAFIMAGTPLGNKGRVDTVVGFGWLLDLEVSLEEAAEAMGLPLS